MKRLIRFWFRWRFQRAFNRADWRIATFPDHPEAATEVSRLRRITKVGLPEGDIWRSIGRGN